MDWGEEEEVPRHVQVPRNLEGAEGGRIRIRSGCGKHGRTRQLSPWISFQAHDTGTRRGGSSYRVVRELRQHYSVTSPFERWNIPSR